MRTLAKSDVGDCGHPGSGASEITCTLSEVREGRYQAEGYYSTGCNQGYYQENYGYGPWRGRGDSIEEAIDEMLDSVPDEYRDDIKRAARDAAIDAEDAIEETRAS